MMFLMDFFRMSMRRLLHILLLLFMVPISSHANNILVLKRGAMSDYDRAVSGITDYFSQYGTDLQTDIKDISTFKGSLSTLLSGNPDVILTIGTKVTKLIKEQAPNQKIVFVMAYEPYSNKILDQEGQPTATITGVTADIPIEQELNHFQQMLPEAKRIGVLYNNNHSHEFITELTEKANSRGLEVVGIDVESSRNVPTALKQIENNIDVFWIVADPTILERNSRKQIMLFWIKKNIPIVGIAANYVKAGALYCVSIDSYEAGQQAARMCAGVVDGLGPVDIPIESPNKFKVVYNSEAAGKLSIKIPVEVIQTGQSISK
ncbi:MAG: hypothetical protein B6244_14360 [Candidatus Cloacimonetes bacterium 4572_55]|nr:MAG: hypothetical protein B6244_14360 [Candidatus Cloacimonetes bacterium 4572_55]